MYINITNSETGNNKGSSYGLVHYLDKENRLTDQPEAELWFNGKKMNIQQYEVRNSLDSNIAKLCKDDAKFFLINISPSQKEIAHLKDLYGNGAKEQLKEFAKAVMDAYAQNFNRNGIDSNADLLWFAKFERYRYYSHRDQEVKDGSCKRGERKPGDQMHVQVIVSRKDITNKIKLSPMNKSRGKNAEHSKKVGQFDRSAFKASGEKLFDKKFSFERGLTETFRYANTRKNGNLEQRIALSIEKKKDEPLKLRPSIKQKSEETYLKAPAPTHYLKAFLNTPVQDSTIPHKRRKKRKKAQQDQSHSHSI